MSAAARRVPAMGVNAAAGRYGTISRETKTMTVRTYCLGMCGISLSLVIYLRNYPNATVRKKLVGNYFGGCCVQ